MRKLLALLLSLVLVFSLAACGGDNNEVNGGATSSVTTESTKASTTTTEKTEDDTTTDGDETTTTTADEDETTTTEDEDETTTTKDGGDSSTTKRPSRSSTSRDKTTTRTQKTTEDEDDTTTTEADDTTTVATMSREEYLNQKKITLTGSSADKKTWVYQLGAGGIAVRETVIDSGRGGEAVEVVQISDIHFNKLNAKDREENNPIITFMEKYRTHMANGASRKNAEACLKYGGYFDQIVVTGDSIDYLTWGAIEMVQDVIWKNYPSALVALGNHDTNRTWGTKYSWSAASKNGDTWVRDKTTEESRYQILQDNWKHDVYYTSKVIKNKVMVIQMDNGSTKFFDHQATKFAADLKTAKDKGYTVLLFVHIPLSTGNAADTQVKAIRASDGNATINLYNTACQTNISSNAAIYDLVKNNADVIKGVFCGHEHVDAYAEIQAKTSDGKDAVIPEYILTGAFYDKGTVMKITVK